RDGERRAPLAGARLRREPRDLLLLVVVRLGDGRVRLVAARRAHTLVLVVDARGRIERLFEAAGAVERRRPPQPIDIPDLLGDRDPPLLAHLLLDELHRKERRQVLGPDRLAGAGMERRGQRGLEIGLDVVPLRRDVLLVEEKLGGVAGLGRHALPPSDLVAAGPREKCANDTQGGPALSIQASARLSSQEGDAMAGTLCLPRTDGTLTAYRLTGTTPVAPPAGPIRSRIAYAAVHVVADPLAAINPTLEAALDWDATLAYRRYIWS